MFDLTGKGALVTGASGGIGSAIARALHQQGAQVVLSGTRREVLDSLAAELGTGAYVVCADLRQKEACGPLVEEATTVLGQLDILVNNAGITRDALFVRMKEADWDEVLHVNLSCAFHLSRAALRGMMSRRWGRIISVSSVVGAMGNPGQANYAAAKAGLEGMTRTLALEVATRHVTVNTVAPGFVETPMTARLNEKQTEAIRARIPTGTLGTPKDVATAVVYLASPEAAYITGQTLHVNGGLLMR